MSDPADIELDENGNVISPPTSLTWKNAGTELPNRLGDAMADHLPRATTDERLKNDLSIMRAKNEAEMFSLRALAAARRVLPNLYAGTKTYDEARKASQGDRPGYAGSSAPRQPIQMQREFSNDAEKEAYLQRIKQAQANAAGK